MGSAAKQQAERRRESRLSAIFSGRVRYPDGRRRSATVSELSANGCRVTGDDLGLNVGDKIQITFGALDEMEGSVRWVNDNALGVKLSVAINPLMLSFLGAYVSLAG